MCFNLHFLLCMYLQDISTNAFGFIYRELFTYKTYFDILAVLQDFIP